MLDSRKSSVHEFLKQCLNPSELEFAVQSKRDDCGCSKNCLSNLIQRFNRSSSSSSNNNSSSNLTSFNVCQQNILILCRKTEKWPKTDSSKMFTYTRTGSDPEYDDNRRKEKTSQT